MHHLSFSPFRLDPASQQLWRGAEVVPLRPKAFLLLRYLAEHPKRLVSQEELLKAVGSTVTSVRIAARLHPGAAPGARGRCQGPALHRNRERARLSVHRPDTPTVPSPIGSGGPAPLESPPGFVGRQEEMAQLHGARSARSRANARWCLSPGRPGLARPPSSTLFGPSRGAEDLRVGRGQCIELLGAAEPYLPLLEALGGLARRAEGRALISLLRRQAPTWLVQIPLHRGGRAGPADRQGPWRDRGADGAGAVRGARGANCAESPLLLWLEDLHWGDPSTVDCWRCWPVAARPRGSWWWARIGPRT